MPETKRKYDPVKRKEYYERTKKLKGRKRSDGRTVNTSDPIGDTLKAIGKPLTWVRKRAAEGFKDAKLTLEVIALESKARELQEEMNSTWDPRVKVPAGAKLTRVLFEIEKRKREIAKSSV